jgi:hypothetical protein
MLKANDWYGALKLDKKSLSRKIFDDYLKGKK